MPVTEVSPASPIQDMFLDLAINGKVGSRKTAAVAASLRPGPELMFAFATGSEVACEIVDAWRPAFNVTTMSDGDLTSLSSRCHCTFAGSGQELR
jgi:hypothetical protein